MMCGYLKTCGHTKYQYLLGDYNESGWSWHCFPGKSNRGPDDTVDTSG